jgi:Zn-dependent oligopeptidase
MLTDYTTMTPERARDVVDAAIAEADALVDQIIDETAPRTYANTMAPLDRCLVLLNDAYGVGGFMARVHPDDWPSTASCTKPSGRTPMEPR